MEKTSVRKSHLKDICVVKRFNTFRKEFNALSAFFVELCIGKMLSGSSRMCSVVGKCIELAVLKLFLTGPTIFLNSS